MLHGADDPHPGTLIHERLATCVPNLELVLLDRCGHEPWRERHAREPFLAALGERLHRLTGG
jgi:pimeloyl-ACP methyl ester carboxylesterase